MHLEMVEACETIARSSPMGRPTSQAEASIPKWLAALDTI